MVPMWKMSIHASSETSTAATVSTNETTNVRRPDGAAGRLPRPAAICLRVGEEAAVMSGERDRSSEQLGRAITRLWHDGNVPIGGGVGGGLASFRDRRRRDSRTPA